MEQSIAMMLTILFFASLIFSVVLAFSAILKKRLSDLALCAVMLAIANLALTLLKVFGGTI